MHCLVGVLHEEVLSLQCDSTALGEYLPGSSTQVTPPVLSAGEMIVGPKRVLFLDEISTGLDSSTTFDIVKYLRV